MFDFSCERQRLVTNSESNMFLGLTRMEHVIYLKPLLKPSDVEHVDFRSNNNSLSLSCPTTHIWHQRSSWSHTKNQRGDNIHPALMCPTLYRIMITAPRRGVHNVHVSPDSLLTWRRPLASSHRHMNKSFTYSCVSLHTEKHIDTKCQ